MSALTRDSFQKVFILLNNALHHLAECIWLTGLFIETRGNIRSQVKQ